MRQLALAISLVALVGISTPFTLTDRATANVVAAPEHPHGEKHKLGRKEIAGYTVSVIVIGEVEAGKHVDFDIKLIDAKTDPKALRVWIGAENASGSTKAAGTKGAVTYTGEVIAPDPLPAGSKLWVELETDAGVQSAAYDYDKHDHKH